MREFIYPLMMIGVGCAVVGGVMYAGVFLAAFDKTFALRPDKQNKAALALRVGKLGLQAGTICFAATVIMMFFITTKH